MVEKIEISRDEVLYYPWIDHTWVYIHYTKNSVTQDPLFSRAIKALFKFGIEKTTGKKFEGIRVDDNYIFIQYKTDEIIEILRNAVLWLSNDNVYVKKPEHPVCKFFLENKSMIYELVYETKDILDRKAYKYYYQCVDGRD